MSDVIYDLVVIGGGINGAGIAADAAARGLFVLLAEAQDLAGATSSASSKLIHGGLRYLENFEFRLVREALAEREVLLAKAGHIVRPMRFVLPHTPGMRPALLMRAGLFLYDHLAARKTLGRSRSIDLTRDPAGAPLASDLMQGFVYWDCAVDDGRLVVLNAIAAREAGARVETWSAVRALAVDNGLWAVTIGTESRRVRARAVVNAAGPWVSEVARLVQGAHTTAAPVRLVKGSHIVVPRIQGATDAYTFQHQDGRVVFAIQFEDAFTLIGTTETPFNGNPRAAEVGDEEEAYLVAIANRYFRQRFTREAIVWRFSGVRALDEDGSKSASAVSRDYRLEIGSGTPPILHVIGGKITTYRKLAEAALKLLGPHFTNLPQCTTATTPLPGGEFGGRTFAEWFEDIAQENRAVDRTYLYRLARRYGTRTSRIVDGAESGLELGDTIGAGFSAREIAYLKHEEWARTADDVLWRRTKAGLHLRPEERLRAADRIQACLDKA
jgi:glycerol-3-phosphate dehydrogenase